MNSNMTDLPLGKSVSYPSGYDAALLFPISRAEARTQIGIAASSALPFSGWDLLNAYEMSWLNLKGLPQVALLRVKVPCASPNIIESKSFKLYLNGFNQTRFESAVQVHDRLINDLSHAAGMPVEVEVLGTELFHKEIIRLHLVILIKVPFCHLLVEAPGCRDKILAPLACLLRQVR